MSQSRTPFKARISAQLSSTGTIAAENHLLKDELAGRLSEVSFAHFFFAFLQYEPDVPQTTEILDAAALVVKDSDTFRALYGRFSSCLGLDEGINEHGALVELMNHVVRFESLPEGNPDALPLTFTCNTSILPLQGSMSKRKPDIVGIPSATPISNPASGQSSLQQTELDWRAVSLVCEYKVAAPNRSESLSPATVQRPSRSRSESQQAAGLQTLGVQRGPKASDLQLARCMLEMRTAQPTREFGYGIQFTKDHASFWRSDADSTITSRPVPVNSKEFIVGIMYLARATRSGLGYSPEFRDATGGTATQVEKSQLTLDNVSYTITHVIYHARAMHGRCSCVLGTEDPAGKKYAIKLSWQVTTRVSEVELIERARERGVHNMAEVLYSQDMRKLSDGLRSRLPPNVCEAVRVKDRCLRVLVLPRYIPLYKVLDPKVFLQACISLLDAIHDLYRNGKILHRDVSLNNLMVREDKQSEGVLIDLDLAHEEKPKDADGQKPTSLHRTGTLPFMALDLLHDDMDDYPHYHRHDLESFVYVLAWIAGRYNDGLEVDKEMFNRWCEGDWISISNDKNAFLSLAPSYFGFTPNPSYVFLFDTLLEFQEIFDEAHAKARKNSIAAHARLTLPTRLSNRDEQLKQGYADGSLGSKRKRQMIPIYPEHLINITRDSICSVLRNALDRLEAPSGDASGP